MLYKPVSSLHLTHKQTVVAYQKSPPSAKVEPLNAAPGSPVCVCVCVCVWFYLPV